MADKKKPKAPKPIPAEFWKTEAGNEPVRDWLKSMEKSVSRLATTFGPYSTVGRLECH